MKSAPPSILRKGEAYSFQVVSLLMIDLQPTLKGKKKTLVLSQMYLCKYTSSEL